MNEIAEHFASLKSTAPFWSLRYAEEQAEMLAVRDDVVDPPQIGRASCRERVCT